MNRIENRNGAKGIGKLVIATPVVTFCLLVSLVLAQSGGDYQLTWSTIDGGGGQSSGGPYALRGTIGQPDAGWMEGGDYEVLGGFWPGGPLCVVEFEDYARFAEHWLKSGTSLPGDLDADYDVGYLDLRLFVAEWLATCPYGWPLK